MKYGELTQQQFATRFSIPYGSLRDVEQGRVRPSPAMRVLVAAIELDPALIDRAVVLSNERKRIEDEEEKRAKRARGEW